MVGLQAHVCGAAHIFRITLERQGRGQCGFILSAAWLVLGKVQLLLWGRGDPHTFGPVGVGRLEPAFLSPGGQDPGPLAFGPAPPLCGGGRHTLAKVQWDLIPPPPFLSAGPVEAGKSYQVTTAQSLVVKKKKSLV